MNAIVARAADTWSATGILLCSARACKFGLHSDREVANKIRRNLRCKRCRKRADICLCIPQLLSSKRVTAKTDDVGKIEVAQTLVATTEVAPHNAPGTKNGADARKEIENT